MPASGESHCLYGRSSVGRRQRDEPSEIAKAAGRSVSRVSNILGVLRLAEVVRYQTEGTRAQYRLKHLRETRRILAALSGFVKIASPTHR